MALEAFYFMFSLKMLAWLAPMQMSRVPRGHRWICRWSVGDQMASLSPECAGPPLPVKTLYQTCYCCFTVSKSAVSGDLGALHHIKCYLQEYLESLSDDWWISGSRQYICSCLQILQSWEIQDTPVSLRAASTVTTHSRGLCGFKQLMASKTAAGGKKTPQWFLSFETYFLKLNISPEIL